MPRRGSRGPGSGDRSSRASPGGRVLGGIPFGGGGLGTWSLGPSYISICQLWLGRWQLEAERAQEPSMAANARVQPTSGCRGELVTVVLQAITTYFVWKGGATQKKCGFPLGFP